MRTKHTPGRWSVSPIHPNQVTGEVGTGLIATVCENRYTQWEANAKLIAAAPELLEAVLIMMEDHGYDLNLPIEGFSHRTQQVINAVKKATE